MCAQALSSSETKDLIHEGIATFSLSASIPLVIWTETKDLIHEGIATISSVSLSSCPLPKPKT